MSYFQRREQDSHLLYSPLAHPVLSLYSVLTYLLLRLHRRSLKKARQSKQRKSMFIVFECAVDRLYCGENERKLHQWLADKRLPPDNPS